MNRYKVLKYSLFLSLLLVALTVQGQDITKSQPKKKQQVVAPSIAWTPSEPLGLRYESTIDTLFENYHASMIPTLRSKAWATTGNYGAEGQDQIFFDREPASDFFFRDALSTWLPSVTTHRFYNTRKPMTLLSYTTGGNKYSNQDRTTAVFSGNVNKQLQIGGGIDYIYSKGSYDYQADKNFMWNLSGSYIGDRYELQTFFSNFNHTNKESGGIVDDRYITDPAAVQGGVTKVNPKDIITNLTASHSYLSGLEFYMNHRYKVGRYRYERDSVTDTIVGRTYIPITSFIWTMDIKTNKHRFKNASGLQDTTYFAHTYLGLGGTDENTRYLSVRNTLGVSLLEGFNKYAKFGFAAYATHELRKYTQVTDSVTGTELPAKLGVLPVSVDAKHTDNLLWVGGQLTKQRGSILTYDATAEFGVMGDVAGDINISGNVATRMFLWRDTVSLRGYGYFKNQKVPYLLRNFVSNHYAWKNDFSKTTRFRVGGELTVPFTGTRVNVGYETLKNYVYFGVEATPEQCGSPVHVFSATLDQRFRFGILNWDTQLTYQTSSNEDVLPLPKFSVYSNLYLKFKIANVLHVQVGVDGNYYTSYFAPAYEPAIMSFHNQHELKCGNFAFFDAYANFKLKQARFYVMYSHVNKGLFGGNNYFAIPHYPLNPGRFQMGVSVNFVN